MVATWVVVGLVVSAISVSVLGAAFSVFGIRDLFAGAALAVILMAASLELAKFTLAAYLHQRWKKLNGFFKYYLAFSVAILSLITSLGIFGFLSNAYQSASVGLDTEQAKLASLQSQMDRTKGEIARLLRPIDEIPANRVTKRMELRKEVEPAINGLNKAVERISAEIDASHLKILEVKQRVGPLIYVSRAFKVEIDEVVKYLIFVFIFVFDPLAISLVIATSEALTARVRKEEEGAPPESGVPNGSNPNDGTVIHMRFAAVASAAQQPNEKSDPSEDEKAV